MSSKAVSSRSPLCNEMRHRPSPRALPHPRYRTVPQELRKPRQPVHIPYLQCPAFQFIVHFWKTSDNCVVPSQGNIVGVSLRPPARGAAALRAAGGARGGRPAAQGSLFISGTRRCNNSTNDPGLALNSSTGLALDLNPGSVSDLDPDSAFDSNLALLLSPNIDSNIDYFP
ncbi:hypothetical protein EVAR_38755_1 [Eumeta japonica]|uniref:Uncharacterized protein n=1 Tax=Eumeta variegata TaxID=151549 RepID=A0A4C1WJF1_EUMVA|nr:hypothetical protein EVAR_38755_1 [Eumeta japonica]